MESPPATTVSAPNALVTARAMAIVPAANGCPIQEVTSTQDLLYTIGFNTYPSPFDLGTNFRTGARQGPAQIREMSRIIRRVNASNRIAPFRLCNVADMGDTPINPFDLLKSVDMITRFIGDLTDHGVAPISAGGDHTITLPILRGMYRGQAFGVVHFDAHADTLDRNCDRDGEPMPPCRSFGEHAPQDDRRPRGGHDDELGPAPERNARDQ